MLALDSGRREPSAREVGHDRADRSSLVSGKLAHRRDHVVVDVQGRSHREVMLAHHNIGDATPGQDHVQDGTVSGA